MSKKRIKKHINHNRKNNTNVMDLVVVDIKTKKMYITSGTANRFMVGIKPTVELIEMKKKEFPFFQITVNDILFLNLFGRIPA